MFGITSTVEVEVDGQLLETARNVDGVGAKELHWQLFTITFTAHSARTTIAFMNADVRTDTSNFIDDVTLN